MIERYMVVIQIDINNAVLYVIVLRRSVLEAPTSSTIELVNSAMQS